MGKWVPLGGSSKPVGYCHYHRFTMSKQQIKAKGCLKKHCCRLEKYDVPYWNDYARREIEIKKAKKLKKEKEKLYFKNMENRKLINAISYCMNHPKNTEQLKEYCSSCLYNKDCKDGILKDVYKYLKTYDKEIFEKYLNDRSNA